MSILSFGKRGLSYNELLLRCAEHEAQEARINMRSVLSTVLRHYWQENLASVESDISKLQDAIRMEHLAAKPMPQPGNLDISLETGKPLYDLPLSEFALNQRKTR